MQDRTIQKPGPVAVLRALVSHIEAYPSLEASLSHVTMHQPYIQLHPWGRGTHLSVFAEWVQSLSDMRHIKLTTLPDTELNKAHFTATGYLRDGTRIDVVCLPDRDEGKRLLDAGGLLEVGDTCPVEVLVKVVSS